MDSFLALLLIGIPLCWYVYGQLNRKKKTIVDSHLCELTDRLHEHKCAIMEVSLFIRQIETMRWNDYKDFRFSFGSGESNFTRCFQSYFSGMSHKKHLRQIKSFAYDYLEDESLKYRQTLEEIYKYFYKINSRENAVLNVEEIIKKPVEIKNDFDITEETDIQVDPTGKKVDAEIEVLQVETPSPNEN